MGRWSEISCCPLSGWLLFYLFVLIQFWRENVYFEPHTVFGCCTTELGSSTLTLFVNGKTSKQIAMQLNSSKNNRSFVFFHQSYDESLITHPPAFSNARKGNSPSLDPGWWRCQTPCLDVLFCLIDSVCGLSENAGKGRYCQSQKKSYQQIE